MTYNLNNDMAHRYNTSLRLYCFCRRTAMLNSVNCRHVIGLIIS